MPSPGDTDDDDQLRFYPDARNFRSMLAKIKAEDRDTMRDEMLLVGLGLETDVELYEALRGADPQVPGRLGEDTNG
jgi:hypothetical protein